MANADFFSFRNLIAGGLRGSEQSGQGVNPSNRKALWDVPIATSSDLEEAVAAATAAFPEWSKTPWAERQRSLIRASEALQKHRAEMANLLMFECGKPPQFADLEVQHAIDHFDYYATLHQPESQIVQDDKNLRLTLQYAPIGVIGAICPWNFPLILAIGKIAPAVLAGNCIIAKPSPFTPYTLLKLGEILKDVFPSGVLQIMHGDDKLGPQMCTHPGIDKITFTGSTPTGKKIMASAAQTLKDVTLELGGNSASIICPDVDVDVVAPQVAMGSFFNSGQLCVASKRIYVHKDIYEPFLKKMVETVKAWKVAPASVDGGAMLGPVQNEMQYNVVKSFFEDTAKNGYKFALGGDQKFDDSSFVIHPAIVANPPDESLVVQGEAFGPIVPVQPWSTEDEVIARVNNTTSGLGGAVWSTNVDRAYALANRIEAGTIWINSFEKPLPQAYLAGHKESGIGGEGGKQGLMGYCKAQMIHHYKSSMGSKL